MFEHWQLPWFGWVDSLNEINITWFVIIMWHFVFFFLKQAKCISGPRVPRLNEGTWVSTNLLKVELGYLSWPKLHPSWSGMQTFDIEWSCPNKHAWDGMSQIEPERAHLNDFAWDGMSGWPNFGFDDQVWDNMIVILWNEVSTYSPNAPIHSPWPSIKQQVEQIE